MQKENKESSSWNIRKKITNVSEKKKRTMKAGKENTQMCNICERRKDLYAELVTLEPQHNCYV